MRKTAPTIEDVARKAGVSISAVSNVFNNRWKQTSKETRQHILEVAGRLNYQPNAMAAALRSRSTRTIGVVVTNIVNPFYTAVVRGIQDKSNEAGYTVLLGNTDDDPAQERAVIQAFRSKQVDGMLIVTTGGNTTAIKQTKALGTPLVLFDRGDSALGLDTARIDNLEAARGAVEYLIGLGHKRIAIISGLTTGVPTRANRLRGYELALGQAAIPVRDEYKQIFPTSAENGYQAANRLLDLRPAPTAIFVTNTFLAIGALSALRERKVAIPKGISLLMFDDPDWATLITPPITAVSQPAKQIGEAAFDLLFQRMKGPRRAKVKDVVLPVQLIVRGSCGVI